MHTFRDIKLKKTSHNKSNNNKSWSKKKKSYLHRFIIQLQFNLFLLVWTFCSKQSNNSKIKLQEIVWRVLEEDLYINFQDLIKNIKIILYVNTLSDNPQKWSNTLKQFIDKLPANRVRMFDHLVWVWRLW